MAIFIVKSVCSMKNGITNLYSKFGHESCVARYSNLEKYESRGM